MNAFNPLAYSKKLQEVGVPEAQAEVHAMALTAVLEGHLVTKDEFAHFEARYEQNRVDDMAEWRRLLEQAEQRTAAKWTEKFAEFEVRWTEKFATFASNYDRRLNDLEQKISELRVDIVKWLLLYWITQVGVTVGLLAILR